MLFLVVYSGTNWLTSQRSDVGTWYYAVGAIHPFRAADGHPLYVDRPVLCRGAVLVPRPPRIGHVFSPRSLWQFSWPAPASWRCRSKLGCERPHVDGWVGALFGWFFAADLPYNLCPSLHIALRTILAETYARHTRGLWNIASHVWFSLVGFSTLLTYQHHVVDVAGGFPLGRRVLLRRAGDGPSPSRDAEPAGRFVLLSGVARRERHGRPLLALGQPLPLARRGLSRGNRRLFRTRPGHLSQNRRPADLEHAALAGAVARRPEVVAAVLPAAMPGMGRGDAPRLDRSKTLRPRGGRRRAARA